MKFELAVGDITRDIAASVDAIVNAANSQLKGGGGVDGAIHRAGGPEILRECREIRATSYPNGLPPGDAVATTAGRLPCRWVIHTVGPVYSVKRDRSEILRSCYTRSLAVADALGATSVAFALISAGVYGWPKEDAIEQAIGAITGSSSSVQEAKLVLYDDASYQLAQRIRYAR